MRPETRSLRRREGPNGEESETTVRLEDTMRQKTGQLELSLDNRGETYGVQRSGEVATASSGTERSGTGARAAETGDVTSTLRTAGCGPARPVVWEGPGGRETPVRQPLPDVRPARDMTRR